MNKLKTAVFTLMVLFSLQPQAGEREVQAWTKVNEGALLIDVRTTEEFTQKHLPNSLHIPYQQIAVNLRDQQIPLDREIVLYCRSGHRAGLAEAALKQAGYQRIYNAGGLVPLLQQQQVQLLLLVVQQPTLHLKQPHSFHQ